MSHEDRDKHKNIPTALDANTVSMISAMTQVTLDNMHILPKIITFLPSFTIIPTLMMLVILSEVEMKRRYLKIERIMNDVYIQITMLIVLVIYLQFKVLLAPIVNNVKIQLK